MKFNLSFIAEHLGENILALQDLQGRNSAVIEYCEIWDPYSDRLLPNVLYIFDTKLPVIPELRRSQLTVVIIGEEKYTR